MKLASESQTLFIPLLGKAEMSRADLFLHDPKAEEIIAKVDYDFGALKQSKWLSMFLSVRALIIDELCDDYISGHSNATVIHLGCGLDSRCLRVKQGYQKWYDIDYAEVIEVRKKFYHQNSRYEMIGSSVTDSEWLSRIKASTNVLVVAEGLTMYLFEAEIRALLANLSKKFGEVYLIFDAYTKKGVRLSKIKNPVKQMDAAIRYGIDRPEDFLSLNQNLGHIATRFIRKSDSKLRGVTKLIFDHLYCGKISQSIYRIYEFELRSAS